MQYSSNENLCPDIDDQDWQPQCHNANVLGDVAGYDDCGYACEAA
jgi:hypothetical protein